MNYIEKLYGKFEEKLDKIKNSYLRNYIKGLSSFLCIPSAVLELFFCPEEVKPYSLGLKLCREVREMSIGKEERKKYGAWSLGVATLPLLLFLFPTAIRPIGTVVVGSWAVMGSLDLANYLQQKIVEKKQLR